MKFEDKEQLRQLLLELHYELLDDEESEQLRAAIVSDPEVATEWAATLRWAGKLADAANIDIAPQPMVKPEGDSAARAVDDAPPILNDGATTPSSNGKASSSDPIVATLVDSTTVPHRDAADEQRSRLPSDSDRQSTSSVRRKGSRKWWLGSTGLAATAAAIGLMVVGSWYGQRLPETPLASVRIEAEPMPPEQAENEREYRVVTSRIDGS
ncbi:MAG: hypothetical protein ACR2NZ_04690, partial [Rubripirellula sp.]